MEKNDYLWKFIQDMEQFYILANEKYDMSNDSLFYSSIKKINNFIYGYDNISLNGVIYGFKLIPEEQNKIWSYSLPVPGIDPVLAQPAGCRVPAGKEQCWKCTGSVPTDGQNAG